MLARWSSSPGFQPRSRQDFYKHKQGSITHSISLSPNNGPDITEILLKGHKIASHPSSNWFKAVLAVKNLLCFLVGMKSRLSVLSNVYFLEKDCFSILALLIFLFFFVYTMHLKI